MRLDKYWGRMGWTALDRTKRATDIILNCTEKSQDAEYAKKHGLGVPMVQKIRLGHSWKHLRRRLGRELKKRT